MEILINLGTSISTQWPWSYSTFPSLTKPAAGDRDTYGFKRIACGWLSEGWEVVLGILLAIEFICSATFSSIFFNYYIFIYFVH